jgi:hypothetical protein
MSEHRRLSLYAIKNDPNILADITFYEDGKIIHHETIVKSKKAFNNKHPSFIERNVLTLEEI